MKKKLLRVPEARQNIRVCINSTCHCEVAEPRHYTRNWLGLLCHPELVSGSQARDSELAVAPQNDSKCHCEGAKRPSQSHSNMPEAVTNGSHLTVNCSQESTHPNLPSQGKENNAPQEVTNLLTYSLNNLLTSQKTPTRKSKISTLPSREGNSHAPQDVTNIKPFNRSTSQLRKRYATQIIRGAAKARFRRTIRAGFADAHTAPYRKFGFTLAEVLITLAIIGVVAALTIPTLINNYQKRVYVTQLQKIYSSLANAAKMVMADEQVDNLNNTYLREPNEYDNEYDMYENSVGKFLKTYFKVAKTCNFDDSSCYAESYKSQDDSIAGDFKGTYTEKYCAILTSGFIICMSPFADEYPITLSVDVNGKSGPNIMGRDAFQFAMNYRGELAEHFPSGADPDRCGDDEQSLMYGVGCFTKIVQDGWRMDY